jgi:hypothetical protein
MKGVGEEGSRQVDTLRAPAFPAQSISWGEVSEGGQSPPPSLMAGKELVVDAEYVHARLAEVLGDEDLSRYIL